MNKVLYQLYETSIKEIKSIRDLSIMYNMQNEQAFINWLGALNELSMDPEQ